MSIYDKQISDLATGDLEELFAETAVENIRLEFKREDVSKNEYLKKLSSFANTYGGFLIVGAEADDTGRLLGLPGVDTIQGFKQRTVQWCYDGVSPPVHPSVSDAIESPQDSARVCYVIFVGESEETPHFLNSRKGCYVRIDELSHHFEPRLATYEDIQHLANRRSRCVERREQLFSRSEHRFGVYVEREYENDAYTRDELGTTLKLAVVPHFPAEPLVDETALFDLLGRTRITNWRGVGFPAAPSPLSQHESATILNPTAAFSILEVNIWGQLYYATEVEKEEDNPTPNSINVYQFVGCLLVFLAHAKGVFQDLGYNGTLSFRLRLERLLGRDFLLAPEHGDRVRASRLDDVVDLTVAGSSQRLNEDLNDIAGELIRRLFFAVNWPEVALSSESTQQFLSHGYEYNRW